MLLTNLPNSQLYGYYQQSTRVCFYLTQFKVKDFLILIIENFLKNYKNHVTSNYNTFTFNVYLDF